VGQGPRETRTKTGTQTLAKALAILDLLREHGQPVRLSRLAEETGLSQTAVHRILREFVAHGLVEQDEATRQYTLGWGVLSYATPVLERAGFVEVAAPVARQLRDAWRETVTVHVRAGDERLVVHEEEGLHDLRRHAGIGQRMPLWASSGGRAILAFMPPEEIERIIAGGVEKLTPSTLTDPDALRERLEETRRTGLAISHDQVIVGLTSVATPIFGVGLRPATSIAISGPSERLTPIPDGLLADVRAAGAAIPRRMGHTAPRPGDAGTASAASA
jgi:DNA-binding IclR family transcriptional regulator